MKGEGDVFAVGANFGTMGSIEGLFTQLDKK
jgi:hypothetical protein